MRPIGGSLLALLFLALSACGRVGGPQSVALDFLEAYYVRADLPAARELAVGLAREKIDREIELRKGAGERGPSPQAAQERRVTFEIVEEVRTEDRSRFLFDLFIGSEAMSLKKRAIISVGQRRGERGKETWVVVNFSEFDLTPNPREK